MNIKNNVTLIGRIGRDLEIQQPKDNFSFLRVSLAVDDSYFDKDKNARVERTQWINCVAKNKTAEHIAKNYSKGDQIAINGKLITRSQTQADGKEMYFTEVEIENTDILLRIKKDQ